MNQVLKGAEFACMLGLFVLGGCATITTGHTQSVVVDTDPQGAECRFKRGDRDVAVVNPTPGTATVDKSFGKMEVRCAKAGFQESAETLAPEFQAMTLGNVILGGVVGIVVDAASGAMAKYPQAVRLTLIPTSFGSDAQRDAYFAALLERMAREAADEEARIKRQCTTEDACAQERKALEGRTRSAKESVASKREEIKIEPRASPPEATQ